MFSRAIALLLLASAAGAVPPTNCVDLPPGETIDGAAANTVVLPTLNKTICLVNKLKTRANKSPTGEIISGTSYSVNAHAELIVPVALQNALTGTESICASCRESAGKIEVIGLENNGPNSIKAHIFNHDTDNIRACNLNVTVSKP